MHIGCLIELAIARDDALVVADNATRLITAASNDSLIEDPRNDAG